MPIFMDRHDFPGVTPEQAAAAHLLDLGEQGAHGVRLLTYWLDAPGYVFCLADAPNEEAVVSVHQKAHGGIPGMIFEVDLHAVTSFLGAIVDPEPGTPWAAAAFRTIMFTDLVGSTALIGTLGDVAAKNLVLDVDASVRAELAKHGGTAVDHTGDGVMASFRSSHDALACAIDIQRSVASPGSGDRPVQVRVGVAAGEPVTENGRLFGAAVNLASRICSVCEAGTIWVASGVRELVLGKGFSFVDRGETTLKGFDEPIRLYEVPWAI